MRDTEVRICEMLSGVDMARGGYIAEMYTPTPWGVT